MEEIQHGMGDLFDQLGLSSADTDIQKFIEKYRTLSAQIILSDATFWTPMQAKFLAEQINLDADWAGIVDELDSSLRK
ncbi:MAG: hypothetical protein ACI9LY_000082 [Arenicella sp.]|jgi:hypothetical protein